MGQGRLLEAALFTLSLFACLFGSGRWIHPAWSIVALANFLWLCWLLFKWEPRGTVLLIPQLTTCASSMVAMIMIEHGAEMFELALVGRPGPWSSALVLYDALYCAGVVAAFKLVISMIDKRRGYALTPIFDRFASLIAAAVLILAGLIAVTLLLRGLISGFPLLAGIDRFQFRRFSADKVTLYALNFKFIIGYALGFIAFCVPASRILRLGAATAFVMLMVLFFLFGDKFFTQLSASAAFFAPYLYQNHRKLAQRSGLYAISGLASLSIVMGVTTYIYSDGFAQSPAATMKRLSGRMVGQGELWFLQASIGAPALAWNELLLERYAGTFTVKDIDLYATKASVGANYFSNRYAPDYLRASLHRNGGTVTYTSVTEAMGLVLFGWLGLGAMMLAIGALVGLVCGYIAFAIENRSVLSGVFAAYVSVQLQGSISQAAPWAVASIYSLRWLMIILLIELLLAVMGQGSATPSLRRSRMRRKASRLQKRT